LRLGASVSRSVRVWADSGYQGKDFMQKVMNQFRWIVEVVKRSDDLAGFVVIPKRWIVERTFGWLNWNRRLSKNYEMLTTTGEAFCYVAMIRIMLRRLENAF
jgi:transposase